MLQWGAVVASVVVVASAVLLLNPRHAKPAENIETVSQLSPERAKETQPTSPPPLSTDAEASRAKKPEELKESDKAKAPVASKQTETRAFKDAPMVQPEPAIAGGLLKDSTAGDRRDSTQQYSFHGATPAPVATNVPSHQDEALQSPAKKADIGNGAADYATRSDAFVGGTLAQQGRAYQGLNVTPAAPPQQTTPSATEANAKVLSKSAAPSPALARSRAKAEDAKSAAPIPAKSVVANQTGKSADDQVPSASQTVEVSAAASEISSSPVAASAPAMATSVPNPLWRITPEGKLLTSRGHKDGWHEMNLGEDPRVTRALYISSGDIWFAGANGRLYHSGDGGKNWSSIKGAWSTDIEIVTMVFRDAQHGELFTSESERWITSDGGKTWRRP
jgi:hypothetical protein